MSTRRYCGFCGKEEREVDRLIAGPPGYICNECIDLMHDMIHNTPKPLDPDPKPVEETSIGDELARRRAAKRGSAPASDKGAT